MTCYERPASITAGSHRCRVQYIKSVRLWAWPTQRQRALRMELKTLGLNASGLSDLDLGAWALKP